LGGQAPANRKSTGAANKRASASVHCDSNGEK
jgi:hypothetical protein